MQNLNSKTRKTIRLKDYDYSCAGGYFVTICTQNKESFFGKIQNDEMFLNDVGKIAENFWQEIPNYFNSAILDEFVIMPNHMHGIIFIENDGVRKLSNHINKSSPKIFEIFFPI